jgi:uncharacterized membrane protein
MKSCSVIALSSALVLVAVAIAILSAAKMAASSHGQQANAVLIIAALIGVFAGSMWVNAVLTLRRFAQLEHLQGSPRSGPDAGSGSSGSGG